MSNKVFLKGNNSRFNLKGRKVRESKQVIIPDPSPGPDPATRSVLEMLLESGWNGGEFDLVEDFTEILQPPNYLDIYRTALL